MKRRAPLVEVFFKTSPGHPTVTTCPYSVGADHTPEIALPTAALHLANSFPGCENLLDMSMSLHAFVWKRERECCDELNTCIGEQEGLSCSLFFHSVFSRCLFILAASDDAETCAKNYEDAEDGRRTFVRSTLSGESRKKVADEAVEGVSLGIENRWLRQPC